MKATKQIVVAGLVALAFLAMPAGLSVRSNESGMALSVAPGATTAYARSVNDAPVKPSGTGTGAATTAGTQASGPQSVATARKRTEGFQTQKGSQYTDSYCQQVADIMDIEAAAAGQAVVQDDPKGYLKHMATYDEFQNTGLDHGCAFIY